MSPVVVPESLREPTLRLFMAQISRERRLNGNQSLVSEDLRRFLWALAHDPAPGATSSANGSVVSDSGTVLLTTQDLADRMGCSSRWARTLAARIGTRVGRQWLVDENELLASRGS